jgi:hypothetical protein
MTTRAGRQGDCLEEKSGLESRLAAQLISVSEVSRAVGFEDSVVETQNPCAKTSRQHQLQAVSDHPS